MRYDPEIPCNHKHEGTVSAGDYRTGPHCSVATCRACRFKSAAFVEIRTGQKADPFLSYEDARAGRAKELRA